MRTDIYLDGVLAECDALKRSGMWAPEPQLRPSAWLDNFSDPDERLLACVLLDNFIFYSNRASDRLLVTAYNRLEDDVLLARIPSTGDPGGFLARMNFTPIEGERPRPTDSGKSLCRKLRDLAGIRDAQFCDPATALAKASAGEPVVFVDDFLGSGQQLLETWTRDYSSGTTSSFQRAYRVQTFQSFCVAMVATDTAISNLGNAGVPVHVSATHIIGASYSVQTLEPPALTPPLTDFHPALARFLGRHAALLDLPPFLQSGDRPLYGFEELGLLLGFEHGVPDSTLPVVWAPGPSQWIRLVKQ